MKSLRENKGLTQEQLARLVNLSQQTIGHYEVDRAKPDLETLKKFADIFNCSVDYILSRTPATNDPAKNAPLAFSGDTSDLNIEALKKIIKETVVEALEEKERKNKE